jgi:hypothetical protein
MTRRSKVPERLYTTKEVAAKLETYQRAIINLSDLHRIPYAVASRGNRSQMRLYTPDAVAKLRKLVIAWKTRPKIGGMERIVPT